MLKAILLLGVFGAGVAVGVIATRNHYATPSATVPQTAASVAPPESSPEVTTPESRAATPLSAVSLPSGNAANVERAETPMKTPMVEAASEAGAAQPVDAGPAFNKFLARASQPGFENQIADAHRALERETRDEGWASTMESELQGAMVNEVATNAFKTEHVECRATMCEVRLSGTGAQQAEALKRWHESFIGRESPLGQRLFLNYGSSITNNEQTDLLMIFRKPPPPGSTPQPEPQQAVRKATQKVARQR